MHDCFGDALCALFTPQHGLYAEKQDNMIESGDRTDPMLNIPVFSLYGKTRIPSEEMFAAIDTLIVDLQDVGTRVYTFMYTVSYCMEAARRFDKTVVILDRPNPLGGIRVEGNCLRQQWHSFVGRFPIPMRHGLTMGELALLFNDAYGIGCRLEVIPMQGWQRCMFFADTGLPWVAPSPNLPTVASALVYPGQVIWEGTNLSEGRGTTQPFELFGAPYLAPKKLLDYLGTREMDGILLRPLEFEPTSNKWQGKRCRGFQMHIRNAQALQPYHAGLKLLGAILACHKNSFAWKQPPYEYEYHKLPIDLILGDDAIRKHLESGAAVNTLICAWEEELEAYERLRQKYLLYA
jgi:uncharacterized protein YbbC (DUF1343 family)